MRAPPRLLPALVALTCFIFTTLAPVNVAAEEFWLFAGQSNMNPGGQSRAAFAALDAAGQTGRRRMVSAQHDGMPIQFWHPDNRGGAMLDAAFERIGDGQLVAFVWQQGETNQSSWHTYGAELSALVARVRERSGNPALPVFLNQLGPRYEKVGLRTKVGTKRQRRTGEIGFVTYWNMAFMRELQRQVALADPHVHLIMTADLTLRDLGVHFDGDSHRTIGQRVAAAAAGTGAGAIPLRVQRDPEDARTVLMTCTRLTGHLQLVDGWQQNLAISPAPTAPLPATLADWTLAEEQHPTRLLPPDGLRFPVSAEIRGDDTVAWTFAEAVPDGAYLHWCFANGSNPEGVVDQGQPSLTGLIDDSGVTVAAAALLPIE